MVTNDDWATIMRRRSAAGKHHRPPGMARWAFDHADAAQYNQLTDNFSESFSDLVPGWLPVDGRPGARDMSRILLVSSCLILLPTTAGAADYAVPVAIREAPVAAPVAYGWTGGYVGAQAGYSFGDNTATFTFFPDVFGAFGLPPTTSLRSGGVTGGLQWGYNYQIGKVVLGTESDISWVDRRAGAGATGFDLAGTPFSSVMIQKLDWLGTSRVRLGVTPFDRLLVYATGGVAYGHVTAGTTMSFPTITYLNEQSRLQVGWTAGAGAEYAFTNALSAKIEYLYYDLGGATVVGLPNPINPPFETHTHFDMTGHVVRAGLNYKINWAPPWTTLGAPGIVAKAPYTREFDVEFGARYWMSSGRTAKDLFDFSGAAMVSRLTYSDITAHTAESFVRVDHWSGAFVKGYLGTGPTASGRLKDEDFPPFIDPQSATTSSLQDGALTYGSFDVGYSFLRGPRYRLGAFAGYHYYHETLNALGCAQIGANPGICNPAISSNILGITNDGVWHSVRLGVNGELMLTDRLKLGAEAAWLPYTSLSSSDTHWLRLNQPGGFSGPIPETGTGNRGYQLEAILGYQVTEALSVGAGGRYWHMETSGNSDFTNSVFGGFGAPQPLNFKSDRYGGFVQAAFRF
jgi:opacity protein-like surface antigen/outer membrane protease